MTWNYLVSLDVGGIHDYIFGTNKLREIGLKSAYIAIRSVYRDFDALVQSSLIY